MTYLGSWAIDNLLTFYANTQVFATGVATDADAVPAYRVYEDETGTPLLTGTMALLDSANTAGFYSEQITLSAANGFEKGKCYSIFISATVSSVAGATHRTFQIEAEVDSNSVSNIGAGVITAAAIATDAIDADAIAANAIDAGAIATGAITAAKFAAGAIDAAAIANGAIDAATFAAGAIDAAAIANGAIDAATFAAGAIDATAIANGAIDAATFAAGAIDAASIAADAITAAKIANGAIDAATFAAGAIDAAALATDAVAEIADGVWDEAYSGHLTSGTFGQALAGIRSSTAQAGAATTITLDAGASAVDDFYNNTMIVITAGTGVGQSRFISDYVGATKVATVPAWVTNPSSDSVFVIIPFSAIAGAVAPTAAEVADAVWDEARASHVAAGSFGQGAASVQGNVTGSIGSLATQAKADVNAEVVDTLATDTYVEPGQGSPAATISLAAKINYMYKGFRNRKTQTGSEFAIYADNDTTKDHEAVVTDDGTTFIRGKLTTGA